MSSTRTSVSDATAADSCSVAEFIASELDSSAVLRPIGSEERSPWPSNATWLDGVSNPCRSACTIRTPTRPSTPRERCRAVTPTHRRRRHRAAVRFAAAVRRRRGRPRRGPLSAGPDRDRFLDDHSMKWISSNRNLLSARHRACGGPRLSYVSDLRRAPVLLAVAALAALARRLARRRAEPADDLVRHDRRRRRRAVLAPGRRSRLEARRARRPRRGAAQGPPAPAAARSVLRAALGLPARRRGVAGARRGARHRRLEPSPRPGARRRRSSRSPSTRSSARSTASTRARSATARARRARTGADDHDRRLGRQPADQRGQVGRAAARGRPRGPQLRRRGRRLRRARRRAPRARPPATPACRTTTTCSSPAASTTPTGRRARSPPGRATPA